MKDAIRNKADVILECGYASASPSYPVLNFHNTKLVTHMDGMEWKRPKWNSIIQKWMRKAEKIAVGYSDVLVCDHPKIQSYFNEKYNCTSAFISYGANMDELPDKKILHDLKLSTGNYFLLIARLEQENNVQMIIDGFLATDLNTSLVVTGNYDRGYGNTIYKRYSKNKKIRFLGSVYNQNILFNLRHFSKALFHGHSVGGTNPSLLEGMAAGPPIIAHNNIFNREILGNNALFFNSAPDITNMLSPSSDCWIKIEDLRNVNIEKIKRDYKWEMVISQYEELFLKLTGRFA